MAAGSPIPYPDRRRVDRHEKALLGFTAAAIAAEVCAAAAGHRQGIAASTFATSCDGLFAHRAAFSAANLVGCLSIMLWPACRRAAHRSLDLLYPGEDSFEAAFKASAGGVLVSAAMAACIGAAVLSGRPVAPRAAALQIATALAGPTVLAFFAARTAVLGAVVLRIYRAL